MTVGARTLGAYPSAGQACRGKGTMALRPGILRKNYPDRHLRSV
jgi:hypothetical protein